jgi:hypothetical protein
LATVTATPIGGYTFSGFTGGTVSGTTNPQSWTMVAPATVIANFTPVSGPTWYNPSWSSRKSITINSGQVTGTLTNFPMLFSVSDATLVGNVQASGNDILFTLSDGTTKLNHQIESYTSATGTLAAWVKVPSLATGTVIYMYYGNPSATNQQSASAVWDSNFEMVQHLPNGATLSATDSTANGCNAATLNSTSAAAGEIAGGASFNGSTNSIDFGTGTALNNWTAQTISLWVKAQTGMAQYSRLIEKGSNNEWTLVWNYNAGSNQLSVQQLGSPYALVTSASPVADNTWHKVDVTISSGSVGLYVDGALSAQAQSPTGPASTTGTIRLGQYGGGGYYYTGLADELRISNTARSAAWLAAEYKNEKSPAAFYTVGATNSSVISGSTDGSSLITQLSSGSATSPQGSPAAPAASVRRTVRPSINGISCTPESVIPPARSTCLVTINTAAPSGGIPISLGADTSNAIVPASVSIPPGATSASFSVATSIVASNTTAHVMASLDSSSISSALELVSAAANGVATDATVTRNSVAPGTRITSPALSTASANELLLAFVSAGPAKAPVTVNSVSGAGLSWVLVRRTNTQPGTAEIWRAFAPATLSNVSVTAEFSANVDSSITVMSFTGVDLSGSDGSGAIGAAAGASAAAGAPTVALTATRDGSLVVGVGNDTTNAIARTPGGRQNIVSQNLTPGNSTFWVQTQLGTTAAGGVGIDDISPVSDAYNLSAVEIVPPNSCLPVLVPASRSFSAGGGSAPAVIGAGPGCAWTASTDSPAWLSFDGGSGSGDSSFTFTAAANNTGQARLGTIGAGGQSFKVLEGGTTQLFTDVTPSARNFDYISLLYSNGIGAGCSASPLMYCPDAPVTRAEMARIVVAALDKASGATSAYTSVPYFEDVPANSPYFAFVQRIRDLGLAGGCSANGARFCPDQPVTQEEMAVLMINAWMQAHGLASFTYTATPYFTDVAAGDPHFKFIQKMMDMQFSTGCSSTEYCPSAAVTRSDMAALVMRSILGAP